MFMNKFLCLLTLVTFPFFAYAEKKIKILEISSYSHNSVASMMQHIGFAEEIKTIKDVKFSIRQLFLGGDTAILNRKRKHEIREEILFIINYSKPDYIYITDDLAFELLADEIPSKIPIIFSGLNVYFSSSEIIGQVEFPDNISGVLELIDFSKLLKLFKEDHILLNKAYLLTETVNSGVISNTSKITLYELSNFLRKNGIPFETIEILDMEELTNALLKIKKENNGKGINLIFLNLLKLHCFKCNKVCDKDEIANRILKMKLRDITICNEYEYCKKGFTFAVGVDYKELGTLAGEILRNQILSGDTSSRVAVSNSYLYVNINNLKNLQLFSIFENNIKLIDGFFNE